jgi:exopolysaccharide biosynthesis WecB/TagA/CpsF family protein
MRHAIATVVGDVRRSRGFCLFTLNLDHCAKLRASPKFYAAYARARYVTADGFPIKLLGRFNGVPVERVTGADLLMPLCVAAARHRLAVFLLGPSTEVLRRARARLAERLPHLLLTGSYAPGANFDPESIDADVACERIRQSGARLCFLAIGAPRQEIFAARCHETMPNVCFVCVGAALDFLAGSQTRAPRFFRDHGLEWAWRLLSNPRRLAARYWQCAVILPRLTAEAIPQAISTRMGRT